MGSPGGSTISIVLPRLEGLPPDVVVVYMKGFEHRNVGVYT